MLEQNLVQLFVGGLNKPHQFLSCVNLATALCRIVSEDHPKFEESEHMLKGFKTNVSNSLPEPLAEADRMFYLSERCDSDDMVSIQGTQYGLALVHIELDDMLLSVVMVVAMISKELGLEFNFNINDYQVG